MEPPAKLSAGIPRRDLRQLLYGHGPERIGDLALQQGAPDLLPRLDEAAPPRFPLKGKDAQALGMRPGPEVGKMLQALEEAWRADDFATGRNELLAKLTDLSKN